jgi:hypothetical protein
MAAVICEDHLGADGSLAEIIDALAAEIPSAGLARKFRELVAARTEYMGREQSLA